MNQEYIPEYRRLKDAGWQVQKQPAVRFNSGSESIDHILTKCVTAHVCLNNGFQIDTEVVHDEFGEIDVLAYAPDRITTAIELETNPDDETIADKKARYVDSNAVIEEIQVIAVDELPAHLYDLQDRIHTELGLF